MTIILGRRSFLTGLSALFVAPAIIRAESLMPIRSYAPPVPDWCPLGWLPLDGREITKKFYPALFRSYQDMRFPLQLQSQNLEGSRTATIISYRDMIRSNGSVMKAGVAYDLVLPNAS